MSATRCPECGFVYDEAAGNPREGFPPGTEVAALPCPDCGVEVKADFEPLG